MSLSTRIARMLPCGQRAKPTLPVLLLVKDTRRGIGIFRRDDTCRHLPACEEAWIRAHGAAQAMCPEACPKRQRREWVAPQRGLMGCTDGATMMGE